MAHVRKFPTMARDNLYGSKLRGLESNFSQRFFFLVDQIHPALTL